MASEQAMAITGLDLMFIAGPRQQLCGTYGGGELGDSARLQRISPRANLFGSGQRLFLAVELV